MSTYHNENSKTQLCENVFTKQLDERSQSESVFVSEKVKEIKHTDESKEENVQLSIEAPVMKPEAHVEQSSKIQEKEDRTQLDKDLHGLIVSAKNVQLERAKEEKDEYVCVSNNNDTDLIKSSNEAVDVQINSKIDRIQPLALLKMYTCYLEKNSDLQMMFDEQKILNDHGPEVSQPSTCVALFGYKSEQLVTYATKTKLCKGVIEPD